MSQLTLFAGPELADDEPQIYSFRDFSQRLTAYQRHRVEDRARLVKQNQSCKSCRRITVEPIELRDGQIGRNGAAIAGTGTLVGFACRACGHEWRA